MSDNVFTLHSNYTCPVMIGADAGNTALVALYRLPQTCTEKEVFTSFEFFVSSVRQLKAWVDFIE
nr:hypothetical protein [Escherichia coli]